MQVGPTWLKFALILPNMSQLGANLTPWTPPKLWFSYRETMVFVYFLYLPSRCILTTIWVHFSSKLSQLRPNLGPTWPNLGPTWGQLGPTWGQLGPNLGPTWANLRQVGPTWGQLGPTWGILEPTWGQLGPTWSNLGLLGTTWGQLEANLAPT